ncbi:uncharacterized protein LOC124445065 isoform X2 [Xenia sp. Carnegie-2017]|uniref:uncharacterized protein LOC124445065 isoform X2 n=1 Tax=Xenia sp. Carnegie-2017 TaxID=2897299 RepID=UPI001F0454C5|nr:uncharacterized protein LOC124445065 isoform X2 [Xenia sp. Carnegie-2017]
MLSTDQASSSLLKSLMLTIEAAVCGNDLARDNVAEMKGVPLLLKSLHSSFLSPSFKVQCLITIAALIEECEPSCEQFVSNNGMSIVVKILAESQNCEELQKSAICVLHTYLEQTKSMPALLMNNEFNAKLSRGNETKTYKDTFSADVEDEKVTVSCVADKMEDLTNEVRILKQLFTSKEKLIQKPVAADIVKRLMKGINLQNDCARDEDNLEQITEIVEDIVIGVSSSTSQKQISLVEPKKRNETAISHINETGNFREISPSRNEDFLELNSVLPVDSTHSKACNKNMHSSKVGDRIDEVMEIAKKNSLIKPGEMQDNNPKSPIDSNVTCLNVSTHFKNMDTSFHKDSISCCEYPTNDQSLSQMDTNEVSCLNSNVDNSEILVKACKERRTDLGKKL